VIDNGVGLPKHNRNRLLEPYVTTKGHKGTGLGLAMVQKITEQHGGTLALEDAPEAPGRTHGALVRITLPLGTSRSGAAPEPSQSSIQQLPAHQA
jgi:two-component system, NtrC family, nitrogen regulation sensor histidine kinase NtrY